MKCKTLEFFDEVGFTPDELNEALRVFRALKAKTDQRKTSYLKPRVVWMGRRFLWETTVEATLRILEKLKADPQALAKFNELIERYSTPEVA